MLELAHLGVIGGEGKTVTIALIVIEGGGMLKRLESWPCGLVPFVSNAPAARRKASRADRPFRFLAYPTATTNPRRLVPA